MKFDHCSLIEAFNHHMAPITLFVVIADNIIASKIDVLLFSSVFYLCVHSYIWHYLRTNNKATIRNVDPSMNHSSSLSLIFNWFQRQTILTSGDIYTDNSNQALLDIHLENRQPDQALFLQNNYWYQFKRKNEY
jgi:hypothetical protein